MTRINLNGEGLESDTARAARMGSRDLSSPETCGSDGARRLALAIAAAGLDKKAIGVEIIDVVGKVDYTEFLVLMSGRTDRHVHAISKGVEDDLRRHGVRPLSVEGLTASNWVLLDFNDAVVHVFQAQTRCFYDLEGLWIDAARIPVPERVSVLPPARSDGRARPKRGRSD